MASAAAFAVAGASVLGLIGTFEGLRTTTYRDSAGIPTICYGHTGPEVRMGQRMTVDQCKALLKKDVQVHRAGVIRCIKVPVTEKQVDALTSLSFNIGVQATCRSTLMRKLNAGDYYGAAQEFPKWNKVKVNGRLVPSNGLTKRRLQEQALFLS